jgi:hypothetical protein
MRILGLGKLNLPFIEGASGRRTHFGSSIFSCEPRESDRFPVHCRQQISDRKPKFPRRTAGFELPQKFIVAPKTEEPLIFYHALGMPSHPSRHTSRFYQKSNRETCQRRSHPTRHEGRIGTCSSPTRATRLTLRAVKAGLPTLADNAAIVLLRARIVSRGRERNAVRIEMPEASAEERPDGDPSSSWSLRRAWRGSGSD